MKTHYFVITNDPLDHAHKTPYAHHLMAQHRLNPRDVLIIHSWDPGTFRGYDLSRMTPLDGEVQTHDSLFHLDRLCEAVRAGLKCDEKMNRERIRNVCPPFFSLTPPP